MCGITGIINLDKNHPDQKVLLDMTNSLMHRGPDNQDIYLNKYIGLGHSRLSIIDLSKRANQPMHTKDGKYVISYSGEVYNFKEIKSELIKDNVKFYSKSDTEVVLNSFAQRGVDALNDFNGMFAFAIWDNRNETVYIARDRYGIKPLYFWSNGKVFLFASEIKAFLKHPEFKVRLDHQTLTEYFTFQNTFSLKTLFKGVELLPPGNYIKVSLNSRKKIDIKKYWDFEFREPDNIKSDKEYYERLEFLFKQAVNRQLVSDVEVGSFLSGGIDSGAIVAIASQNFTDLKTFSIGFDLSSASGLELSFDERKKAEHVSYLYKTEHYEMVLKSGDMQRSLPSLVWTLEDLRLGQCYPNFYADKLSSKFVKVCLSGCGGDELFAGYPWRYYKVLKSKNFDEYINGYYRYWQRIIPDNIKEKFFGPIWNKVKDVSTKEIFKNVFKKSYVPKEPEDYINQSLYFEAKTFLQGLFIIEDKLSMAYGLEVRVPFMDNDIVDFAMKVPVRLKLKDIDNILKIDEDEFSKRIKYFERMRDGKMILRKVLSKYIDNGVMKQFKQGFSGPDASWFKGESIEYVKELLYNKKAGIYDYLDYKTVVKFIEEHISGKFNHRLLIWSLLSFEWWIKIFLNKEYIG